MVGASSALLQIPQPTLLITHIARAEVTGAESLSAAMETQIYKVIRIDDSETLSVAIEYLYPSGGAETDRISRDALTGVPVEKQPMGYIGPRNYWKSSL